MFAECGRLRLAALILSGLCAGAPAARAESLAKVPGAEVELIAGAVSAAQADAGIEVRLAPGWKTYWRYPGDSGVPPALSFEGSQNVAGVEMEWPAPRRFADGGGGSSIGYKGAVLFPLKVRLADPGKPARLQVAFDFAVCEALCMPAKVDLALVIDAAGGADAARIVAARGSVPVPQALGAGDVPSVRAVALDTAATPARLVIDVKASSPKADLFAEGPDAHWALPLPQKTALPDGAARFVVPLDGVPSGIDPAGAALTLTLVDGSRAVTTTVPVPKP
ncbi:protein-disulfide reductase DsbD domain-containing protein [Xanthobacter autotrophicus]|uniref:protein-disulfide reductase DsbD domain-containing protein n=2 Tax=Xanthobacter TaxID=279 RepID=UPI0024AD3A22|nr:protein-disulfide reductase DsbD domain-containing protein [Xanthobacter autotrophicus]